MANINDKKRNDIARAVIATCDYGRVNSSKSVRNTAYSFSCEGHGAVIVFVDAVDIPAEHVEQLRARNMVVDVLFQTTINNKGKYYTSDRYDLSGIPAELKKTVLILEEDADWAYCALLINDDQLDKLSPHLPKGTLRKYADESLARWNTHLPGVAEYLTSRGAQVPQNA